MRRRQAQERVLRQGQITVEPGISARPRSAPGALRECRASSEATVSYIKRSLTVARRRACDNFLYGFKGARLRLPPGAGWARRGIELETRSAVEACVGSASVTTRARA